MAYIDTNSGFSWLERKPDLVARLRKVLMEELDAIGTYDQLSKSVRMMATPPIAPDGSPQAVPEDKLSMEDAKEIAELFDHIKDEETAHAAVLIDIMKRLDGPMAEILAKGVHAI